MINIEYEYAIIYANINGDNLLFESIKTANSNNIDLNLTYKIDVDNFKLKNGKLNHTIPNLMILIFHIIKLFNMGTIYICCNPKQSEELRSVIDNNKVKLEEFELKVVVGDNIIKLT